MVWARRRPLASQPKPVSDPVGVRDRSHWASQRDGAIRHIEVGQREPGSVTSIVASSGIVNSLIVIARILASIIANSGIMAKEDPMRVNHVIANLHVADIEAAKSFYTGFLSLSVEEFNLGWAARFTSPDTEATLQLVTRDDTASENAVISVLTDDIDGAYEEAKSLGCEIVHPLTTEAWNHRRFLIRAPDRNVINVGYHPD